MCLLPPSHCPPQTSPLTLAIRSLAALATDPSRTLPASTTQALILDFSLSSIHCATQDECLALSEP